MNASDGARSLEKLVQRCGSHKNMGKIASACASDNYGTIRHVAFLAEAPQAACEQLLQALSETQGVYITPKARFIRTGSRSCGCLRLASCENPVFRKRPLRDQPIAAAPAACRLPLPKTFYGILAVLAMPTQRCRVVRRTNGERNKRKPIGFVRI